MADPWCILTTRMGADIREPTDAQLRAALQDVYASDDDEHPDAWVRLGEDDGPLFVVAVHSSRRVEFTQWADADYENELAPQVTSRDVPSDVVLAPWRALRDRDVDAVQRHLSI